MSSHPKLDAIVSNYLREVEAERMAENMRRANESAQKFATEWAEAHPNGIDATPPNDPVATQYDVAAQAPLPQAPSPKGTDLRLMPQEGEYHSVGWQVAKTCKKAGYPDAEVSQLSRRLTYAELGNQFRLACAKRPDITGNLLAMEMVNHFYYDTLREDQKEKPDQVAEVVSRALREYDAYQAQLREYFGERNAENDEYYKVADHFALGRVTFVPEDPATYQPGIIHAAHKAYQLITTDRLIRLGLITNEAEDFANKLIAHPELRHLFGLIEKDLKQETTAFVRQTLQELPLAHQRIYEWLQDYGIQKLADGNQGEWHVALNHFIDERKAKPFDNAVLEAAAQSLVDRYARAFMDGGAEYEESYALAQKMIHHPEISKGLIVHEHDFALDDKKTLYRLYEHALVQSAQYSDDQAAHLALVAFGVIQEPDSGVQVVQAQRIGTPVAGDVDAKAAAEALVAQVQEIEPTVLIKDLKAMPRADVKGLKNTLAVIYGALEVEEGGESNPDKALKIAMKRLGWRGVSGRPDKKTAELYKEVVGRCVASGLIDCRGVDVTDPRAMYVLLTQLGRKKWEMHFDKERAHGAYAGIVQGNGRGVTEEAAIPVPAGLTHEGPPIPQELRGLTRDEMRRLQRGLVIVTVLGKMGCYRDGRIIKEIPDYIFKEALGLNMEKLGSQPFDGRYGPLTDRMYQLGIRDRFICKDRALRVNDLYAVLNNSTISELIRKYSPDFYRDA